jgi:hypothetical protein
MKGGVMREVASRPGQPIRQGLASPPVSSEKANAAIRSMLLGKQQNEYCILGGHLVCEAGNEALNSALGRDVGMVSYSSIGRAPCKPGGMGSSPIACNSLPAKYKYPDMKILLAFFFTFVMAVAAQARGTIVLVVDISNSLSPAELEVQYSSYTEVLRSIPYLEGINIEVVLFENEVHHVSSGSALAAAAVFDELPRSSTDERGITCLNQALQYVDLMLPTLPQPVVVDISGDGDANCDGYHPAGHHGPLHETLDRLANQGVIINTLFMIDETFDYEETIGVEEYMNFMLTPIQFYESLRRNNGFSITAEGIMHFEEALFRKLSLELAQLP